jgi:hypothetical protein
MTTQIDIKSLTAGSDKLYRRDIYESSIKPMYRHIWFENDINCESDLEVKSRSDNYIRSRKTYRVHSNWIEDNENEEYINASKLFEIKENILSFSDSQYQVIWIDIDRYFYVKKLSNNSIYKFDESDIKLIHKSVYGESVITRKLKSITILPDGKCQYNYEPKFIFSGKPLDLNLFVCFIANSFDVIITILQLKNLIQ